MSGTRKNKLKIEPNEKVKKLNEQKSDQSSKNSIFDEG